jgi:N-acetylglucosamine repressor
MITKNSPIDSKGAGERNEKLILSLLRKHGKLSQTQLCRLAGIGSSTASTIVLRLREKNLISERQGESNKRGPKPVLLELNPNSHYVIAMEINPSYLVIGIYDSLGSNINKIKLLLGADHSVERVVELVSVNLAGLISRSGIEEEKILGLGITLSGSVSPDGVIQLSSPLGWREVHLRQILQKDIKYPIRIYSTKVRILAEIAAEPSLAAKNILYLNVANGVGSTLYMNGQIMDGATGRFGEIGHTIVDPRGPLCGCGHYGCLETFISGPAIARKIRSDIKQGTRSLLRNRISGDDDSIVPEEVIKYWSEAMRQGDPYSLGIREQLGKYLGQAAVQAINAYDPETVVLAGYVCQQCPEYLAEAIRERMRTEMYDWPLRKVEIIAARCGEDVLINGVTAAVLQRHYE